MVKKIARFFVERARYNSLVRQLETLSDRELRDIGIGRSDIHYIALQDMIAKRTY